MGDVVMMLVSQEALDPDVVKPGWVAMAVVVGLCLGVVVLARSFAKHARRANQPWEGDEDTAPDTAPDAAPDPGPHERAAEPRD